MSSLILIPISTCILIFGFMFGFLSRLCGGMKPDLPYGLDQHLYALPYGIIGALCGIQANLAWYFVVPLALISYVFAYLGKRTGHGPYIDLATWLKKIKRPTLDFIVKYFWGKDPNTKAEGPGNYWRDVTGLAVTGAFVTLGAVFSLLITGHFLLALVLLISGALKSAGYMTGWWAFPEGKGSSITSELDEATELGEGMTGLFGGIGIGVVVAVLLSTLMNAGI